MYRIILFVLGIFFVPFFAYADLGGDNIGGGEVIAGWREQASQDVIRARTIIMDAGTITNNNDGSINYHPASSDLVKANFIGKPLSSASLASALTDETGTGLAAFNTNPVFSGLVDNQTNDAATATVSELYRLTHTSTGTVVANFGAGIDTYLEDASGNSDLASRIATIWTDPTEASEDSAITFSGVSAGGALTEWGRFYGAASGTGGRLKVNTDNTAVTKTDGIILSNSTAATAGVPQQESPILVFSQQRWNGSSSDTYDIGIQATLNGSGDSIDVADGYLKFLVRTNGGAWTSFFTEQGNGNITLLNLMGFNVGEASNTATGLTIVNSASATSILDQFTPPLRFYSPGWKTNATAASQTMSLGYINAPEQGAVNPIGVHRVYYGTNTTTPDLSNELYRLEWGDRLGVVFNEPAADQDFRIESDTITNAFDLDGATGAITLGGALTVSGTTTLGTVAGAIDAGGATSFEVPNGANPTVDAAGEVGVDTSATSGAGLRFYADAAYHLPGYFSKSFIITSPTATADAAIWRVPYAITIRAIHGVQVGGTNVVGMLTECDANGLNPVVVDSSDMTITTSNVNDDGSLSNPSIDSGDYLGWATTSVSGTITRATITFEYTVDAVN